MYTKVTISDTPRPAPGSGKRFGFFLILVFLLAGLVELLASSVAFVLSRRLEIPYIPSLSNEQIDTYLKARNPLLGWGPAVDATGKVIALTPRIDPLSRATESPCVSVYGDSFTFGAESTDDATYPHFLAERLGCTVNNYGIGGYGSDQALMLFRAQSSLDRAPIVILGHLSENILRNVTQFRNLLYPNDVLGFKPRFLVEGGQLRYIPPPTISRSDVQSFTAHPESMLPFDAFVDRTRLSFPYSIALLRFAATDFHVRARFAGIPWYAPFYEREHPALALDLTTRILVTFIRDADAQGRKGFVLLIPTGPDLLYARKTGTWTYQTLKDALAREGVPVIDAGPPMLSRVADGDPCQLFHSCHSHFNGTGYRMLADIVAENLRRTNTR